MQHITPDGPSPGSLRLAGLRIDPVFDGPGRVTAREVLVRSGVEDGWACHEHLLDSDGRLAMAIGGLPGAIRRSDRTRGRRDRSDPHRCRGRRWRSWTPAHAWGRSSGCHRRLVHPPSLRPRRMGHAARRSGVPEHDLSSAPSGLGPLYDRTGRQAGCDPQAVPLTEQLETFDGDHTVLPGLDARAAPGHTPGTTIYIASGDGARALLLGDVVHSVVELTEPDWDAVFDVTPSRPGRDGTSCATSSSTPVMS